ncbi:hypothetical protein [Actinokineospora cianjurensis]|uniref:Small CPxCG-related zinc finger protein n=1 Tax=Actinokineospora cianjurensis TaxID=585224 RepID=A0A421AVW8_9PSEU|nr:hypothetical protein [Actinokineospora cianjurensis]RLK54225.1 hypothetical protein CLV68_6233 [Actinokineospora cianjurensis]
MAAVTCSMCGRDRDGDPPLEALAWAAEQDERGTTWLCPACARKHVRDIEGKLPADYW